MAGYCRERRALSRNIAAGKGLPDSSRLSVSGPEIEIRGLPLLSGNVESGAGIAFVGATEIRSRLGLCRADGRLIFVLFRSAASPPMRRKACGAGGLCGVKSAVRFSRWRLCRLR